MKSETAEKVILTTLGVASGALVGLLLAPDKGSKLRKRVTRQGEDYLRKIKKDLDELRAYLNARVERAEAEMEIEPGEMTAATRGTAQAVPLEEWTKDRLYERAKMEKISGYSRMNKAELIQALKNNRPQ